MVLNQGLSVKVLSGLEDLLLGWLTLQQVVLSQLAGLSSFPLDA